MNTTRDIEIQKSFEVGEKEQKILRTIGYFYHDAYAPDTNKAYQYIRDLGIHKIIIEDNAIYICLERPGLFIGLRGSNIEALQKYLSKNNIEGKLSIVEVLHSPMDYLTSWQYMYTSDDEL
jgi:hypothetical protein